MKKGTMKILDNYIKNYVDYQTLSATKMAIECNVSPATITRYVQKIGYKDFYDFRFQLINRQLELDVIAQEELIINRKIDKLKYSLKELTKFNFEQLKLIEEKKILVYATTEFEKVGELFVDSMAIIHGDCVLIKNRLQLEYLQKKNNNNCVVFSIGRLPIEMYSPRYRYWQFKYQEDDKTFDYPNVLTIKLIETDVINSRTMGMYFALEIIEEEYTTKILSNKEVENLIRVKKGG